MKKIVILALFACFVSIFAFSQVGSSPLNEAQIGVDTAQQKLAEVSVSRFEDAGYWYGYMSHDLGIITLRAMQGGPAGKENRKIAGEEASGIVEADGFVLAARVDFYKRASTEFYIRPVRPLPIEGISKSISIWVAGRNFNHTLKVTIIDHFGNTAELTLGRLNFSGWKKLSTAVPPNIVQRNYHYNNRMGIKIVEFKIECDPMESYGSYYIYLDELRAITDLFAEESRDPDDMIDTW